MRTRSLRWHRPRDILVAESAQSPAGRGEARWKVSTAVSQEVLVKIHKHLRYVLVLLGDQAAETRTSIRRAQERIEKVLGRVPLLMEGESPRRKALEHLEEANALAKEHLEPAGRGRRIRSAIRETLSEARREL